MTECDSVLELSVLEVEWLVDRRLQKFEVPVFLPAYEADADPLALPATAKTFVVSVLQRSCFRQHPFLASRDTE